MSSFTVNPSSCQIPWDYWHTKIMTTCIYNCKIAQWDGLFITGKKREESEGQRVKSCWHAVDSFMSDVVLTSQWDSCVYAADSFSLVSTRGKYLWTWCSHGTDHFLGIFGWDVLKQRKVLNCSDIFFFFFLPISGLNRHCLLINAASVHCHFLKGWSQRTILPVDSQFQLQPVEGMRKQQSGQALWGVQRHTISPTEEKHRATFICL